MKKYIFLLSIPIFLFTALSFIAPFDAINHSEAEVDDDIIQWYTWEEAMNENRKKPKKLFVDIYTDWCGYCKKMDKTTFTDKKVVKAINKDFYAVKLNAEQRKSILHDGHEFKYVKSGRRGVHELAYALTNGKLSYPTYVYLNEKLERITISPGYKKARQFLDELTWVANEEYKKPAKETPEN